MKNKNNITLALGLVLSLCSIYPAYSQDTVIPESEAVQETPEIKVDKDTPEDVIELIKKKDYNSALPLLNAYIASKPKKYIGYKLRGDVYYALRRYNLARDDFQKAVDIKTEDDKFVTGAKVISAVVLGANKQEQYQNPELGVLYGKLMYAQMALNDNMYEVSYKKALEYNSHLYLPAPKKEDISRINCPQKYGKEFNPQGIDAEIANVIEEIEKGHFSEAVYRLPKITGEYPNYYLGQYLTGVVMHGMEQEENAITAFNNSLKLNPYDFESYASLGLIYYEKAAKTFDNKYAEISIDNFRKALALNPDCNTYYFYIGLNYLELGDYDVAVENFQRALAIKSNDYNSMYYKSIAQYLQKDYSGTVEETTKMLYRRVSNYNSVLYLRALAYYKMKNIELATADIEKIHQNMNDIYNVDVKHLSAKDKVLDCYIYYLQSKIARDNGFGAKSDLQRAYQNPIIALLDTRSKDFEHANFKLTSSDISTQYEYLITTFDELGVGFVYLNPDYKVVAKKQTASDDKVAADTQKEQATLIQQDETQLTKSSSPVVNLQEDTLPQAALTEEEIKNDEIQQAIGQLIQEEKELFNEKTHNPEISEVDNSVLSESEEKLELTKAELKPVTSENEEQLQLPVPAAITEDNKEAEDVLPSTRDNELPDEIVQLKPVNPVAEQEKTVPAPVLVFDPDTLIFTAPDQSEVPPVKEPQVSYADDTAKQAETAINNIQKDIQSAETADSEIMQTSDYSEKELVSSVSEKVEQFKQMANLETDNKQAVSDEIPSKLPVLETNKVREELNTVSEAPEIAEKILPVKPDNIMPPETILQEAADSKEQTEEVVAADNLLREDVPVQTLQKEIAKQPVKINEKYADVNLADFEVKNKKLPELKEDDEVVFLEPESFLKKQEQIVSENLNKLSLTPTYHWDDSLPKLNSTNSKQVEEKAVDSAPDNTEIAAESNGNPVEVNITKDSDNLADISKKETLASVTETETKEDLKLIEPEEIEFPKIADNDKKSENISEMIQKNEINVSEKGENDNKSSVKQYIKEEISEISANESGLIAKQAEEELGQTPETGNIKISEASDNVEQPAVQEIDINSNKMKKSKNKSENVVLAENVEPVNENQAQNDSGKEIKESKETIIDEKVSEPSVTVSDIEKMSKTEEGYLQSQKDKSSAIQDETKTNTNEEIETETEVKEKTQSADKSEAAAVSKDESDKVLKEETEQVKPSENSDTTENEKSAEHSVSSSESDESAKTEDETIQNNEEESSSEKVEPEKQEVKKVKKISFWKRLFSRKKTVSEQEKTSEPKEINNK